MITETLAEFAANYASTDIPSGVPARALDLMTDLVASILRASAEAESTGPVLAMVDALGLSGQGTEAPCTVFGMDRRFGAAAAALLNGTLGHSLDFDDTHADSSLHPSAPVIPAALAAAELTDATGAELLAAIVIGFETCCRIGLALDPTAHYARGFHPTATAGTFGAAAAAGRLFGLDCSQMVSAFGVAASQASGSLQFLENGAWNKRYQVGEAAMKGLMAARLAAQGFVGATHALEGEHGFLAGYSDGARPDLVTAGLGQRWETLRIGVKPYPACRYTHAAVDGLLALKRQHGWQAEMITSIEIGLHRNGIALVGDPLDSKRHPKSIVDGQFSMPFAAAVALLRDRFGWDDYDLLGQDAAEAIAARVNVVRDTALEGLSHPFGATLKVVVGNHTYDLAIPDPSGEPETFPGPEDLEAKFTTLAAPVLRAPAGEWLSQFRAISSAGRVRDTLGHLPR